jgi:NhaA family Na+:H+ antiporter
MPALPRPPTAFRSFISSESAAGLVLMGAAAIAMIVANSPLGESYLNVLHEYVGPRWLEMSVEHWINDALMAIFFLLVGLEIKREVTDGQLSTWPRRILPGFAAIGGMAVPALIFVGINVGAPENLRGWAIPAATDIAFALGVLALLGKRVPISLKIFLTALAILDDLGAILIIAIFYSSQLDFLALTGAGLVLFMMLVLNRLHVNKLLPYLFLAVILWWFVYQSGIHATIAGVAAAMMIPVKRTPTTPETMDSPLHRLEHRLHPWVGFLILPIFGFANAGVPLANVGFSHLIAPGPLGVALGLFFGKQIGVFLACLLAAKLKIAERPAGASWLQVYGVSLLCGIGFTMSLFISLLAFAGDVEKVEAMKLGILLGSMTSALVGAVVLLIARPFDIEADRYKDALERAEAGRD